MSNRQKKLCASIISILLVFTFFLTPLSTCAASKKVKRGTTYRECYKVGDIVYCANYEKLFKVDLNTKEVELFAYSKDYRQFTNMKKKGNYLYYELVPYWDDFYHICRINLKTKKITKLSKYAQWPGYVINKNKIYYKCNKGHYSMNLNGKHKKRTKYKIKMTSKRSNADGYKVIWHVEETEEGDYYSYYLRTPQGDIFLEKD